MTALGGRTVHAVKPDLDAMLAEMRAAPDVVRPSRMWERLASRNLEQLRTAGIGEFKRTVNSNYFQWLPTSHHDLQLKAVLRLWRRRPNPLVVSARFVDDPSVDSEIGDPFTRTRARVVYKCFVAMYWDLVRRRLPKHVTDVLYEPEFGRPLAVTYRGRSRSQDLANSAFEYGAIREATGEPEGTVVELGGGYGRLAWVFLRTSARLRYVLVDIPPALAVAEEYLTTVLPERRAFRFRRFSAYDDVRHEFENAEIAFMTPNQLDLVPPLGAWLFVNISSLHEMRRDQVEHYFRQIERHAAGGYFYTKQWRRWHNPDDDITVDHDDYPVPNSWRVVFDRQHPIQTEFFEALYELCAPHIPVTEVAGDVDPVETARSA
jgi:putative sugar O-methyltransferase